MWQWPKRPVVSCYRLIAHLCNLQHLFASGQNEAMSLYNITCIMYYNHFIDAQAHVQRFMCRSLAMDF